MLSDKDYCDYDTCVALMELGYYYTSHYNWRSKDDYLPATAYWRVDMIPMIHLYDAQKWLREQRSLCIDLYKMIYGGYSFHVIGLSTFSEEKRGKAAGYEEALLEGIKEAIRILKEGKYERHRNKETALPR